MPLLWSAWLELASIFKFEPEGTLDCLPTHWVRNYLIDNFRLDALTKKVRKITEVNMIIAAMQPIEKRIEMKLVHRRFRD